MSERRKAVMSLGLAAFGAMAMTPTIYGYRDRPITRLKQLPSGKNRDAVKKARKQKHRSPR